MIAVPPLLLRTLGLLLLAGSAFLTSSCGNFRKLGRDLKLVENEYRISAIIENADDFTCPVRAAVIEWDRDENKVFSGDRVDLTAGGGFMFIVKSPVNQHVLCYADTNRDGIYQPGEPLWVLRGPDGQAAAAVLNADQKIARIQGSLSTKERLPDGLAAAVQQKLAGKDVRDVISQKGIQFAMGEVADLDDPRFAATRGPDGLWTPATSAIRDGLGVYFVEPFDPSRTPVLFVHGAAGSPQDFRLAMDKLDRSRHQAWFYVYPSGMRLENAAIALDRSIRHLHDRYEFRRLHVVAHSMGGLVSRRFIQRNVLEGGNSYIRNFITYSSPWGGHEAAEMGVKFAPKVVPSWRDMAKGSPFLDELFDQRLKGRVNHHLFYSHHAKRSPVLPAENDGTVSVASQLRPEAVADAIETRGFDEDHVSILSSREALLAGKRAIDAAH